MKLFGKRFFLPKYGGGYQVIGLVEVVWKVYATVLNFSLNRSVILYDVLHGFRLGRGIGTETLEAKLAQDLAGLAHEPLLQVFLDVCKVYKSLNRGLCTEILWYYGMGLNMDPIPSHHWDNQQFVQKAGRFLGKEFGKGIGVMQGNPKYPMLFNIMMYAGER